MNTMTDHGQRDFIDLFSDQPVQDWTRFYRQVFRIQIPGFNLPESRPEGFDWPVYIPRHLTINHVLRISQHFYPLWIDGEDEHQTDLFITHHDRIPFESYLVWVQPFGREGNEGKGMTLLERLVLECYAFWKAQLHLDLSSSSFCTGSAYVDGGIPCLSYSPKEGVQVNWHPFGVEDESAIKRLVYSDQYPTMTYPTRVSR